MPSCRNCAGWAGDESWRTLCRSCFAASKREEQREIEEELAFYRAKCSALEAKVGSAGIPDDKVRKLLQLCHPDKHNNSKTATEVTQWLLTFRRR